MKYEKMNFLYDNETGMKMKTKMPLMTFSTSTLGVEHVFTCMDTPELQGNFLSETLFYKLVRSESTLQFSRIS